MSQPTVDPDPARTRKPRIAVVFGGRSDEHSISCLTAGSVLAAIDPQRYDVVPVGITREGRWVLESADPARLAITAAGALPEVDGSLARVALGGEDGTRELVVQ
jgi:D-alanine-D-alanine ligase